MRNNILTLLVGFFVLAGSVLLFKLGMDRMTQAGAAPSQDIETVSVDMNRREILYKVQPGDTLWRLADRFYGNGRRWQEIASANGMGEKDGLIAGQTIKIPLASGPANIPEPVPASYDFPSESPLEQRAAGAVELTLCKLAPDTHPKGLVVVAATDEDESVALQLFDAGDTARTRPVFSYAPPRGDRLSSAVSEDIDGDGREEMFTVWKRPGAPHTSRVFRVEDGTLSLVCETPDDPIAVLRERESTR